MGLIDLRALLKTEYYVVICLSESPFAMNTKEVRDAVLRKLGVAPKKDFDKATKKMKAVRVKGRPSYTHILEVLKRLEVYGWVQRRDIGGDKKELGGWHLTPDALKALIKSGDRVAEMTVRK